MTPPRTVYQSALDTRFRRIRSSRIASLRSHALLDTIRNVGPLSSRQSGKGALDPLEQMRDRKSRTYWGASYAEVELGNVQQQIKQLIQGANGAVHSFDDDGLVRQRSCACAVARPSGLGHAAVGAGRGSARRHEARL